MASTTNDLFTDFRIICDMRNSLAEGWTYEQWVIKNLSRVHITLPKSINLWDKAVKGQEPEYWAEYLTKMAQKFTKYFVMEINLLEREGCDGDELTNTITTTLSECWG